jgi:hypothetical protein
MPGRLLRFLLIDRRGDTKNHECLHMFIPALRRTLRPHEIVLVEFPRHRGTKNRLLKRGRKAPDMMLSAMAFRIRCPRLKV